jgi:hypothetical protein
VPLRYEATFRVLLQTDAIPMFCFSGFADASVKPCPPKFVKGSQPHDKVDETEKQNYRHNGSDDAAEKPPENPQRQSPKHPPSHPSTLSVLKTTHATGFSQWLMTNFSERRIHSAKNRLAHLLPCRNFSVGQEPDPPKVGKTGGRIS